MCPEIHKEAWCRWPGSWRGLSLVRSRVPPRSGLSLRHQRTWRSHEHQNDISRCRVSEKVIAGFASGWDRVTVELAS